MNILKSSNTVSLIALSGLMISACQNEKEKNNKQDDTDSANTIENVIVIISDDHSFETLGCYGNDHIRTPGIDKLASQGMLFNNAYSQAPLCAPSRQSILSGKYPHASGVSLVFTPFPDSHNTTIAEVLQDKGYATCLIGKTHFNNHLWWDLYKNGFPKYGFDTIIAKQQYKEWLKNNPMPAIPANVETRHFNSAAHKNPEYLPAAVFDSFAVGTFYTRTAIDFIKEQNRKDKPFFLWLAFHEPHAPFDFPIEYANMYNPDSLPLGKKGPEDERWIPEMFRNLTEKERRGIIASYYTSVSYMDKNVGLVMDALDNNGLRKNTLVVYTSDQGYLLNDHGRFEKHTMWEQSVCAPLVISGPGISENASSNALIELLDLGPTFMDALGFVPYEDWQGKSFWDVLMQEKNEHRDFVFSTYHHDNKAMIANEEWKFIFTSGHHDLDLNYQTGYGPSGIYLKLYNLKDDPEEFHNLAYKTEYIDTVKFFRDVMLEKFMQTHPDAGNVPEELNKIGKLVWFCEPRDAGSTYGPPTSIGYMDDSLKIALDD